MTFTGTTIKKLQSLALTPEQFDAVIAIMEEAKEAKRTKKGSITDRITRGTRLPDDWKLPRAWGEFALTVGLRENEVRTEAERFKNHWHSAPGIKGIKLKWFATWRNWVISSAERLGRTPNPAAFTSSDPNITGPAQFPRETWERIVRVWRLTNNWHPDNGASPGQPGCLVPPDLLVQVA